MPVVALSYKKCSLYRAPRLRLIGDRHKYRFNRHGSTNLRLVRLSDVSRLRLRISIRLGAVYQGPTDSLSADVSTPLNIGSGAHSLISVARTIRSVYGSEVAVVVPHLCCCFEGGSARLLCGTRIVCQEPPERLPRSNTNHLPKDCILGTETFVRSAQTTGRAWPSLGRSASSPARAQKWQARRQVRQARYAKSTEYLLRHSRRQMAWR